jgi:hypothetical protein
MKISRNFSNFNKAVNCQLRFMQQITTDCSCLVRAQTNKRIVKQGKLIVNNKNKYYSINDVVYFGFDHR